MFFRNMKVVLCILLILSVVLFVFNDTNNYLKACFTDYPLYDYVFVLDAGHGGLVNTIIVIL